MLTLEQAKTKIPVSLAASPGLPDALHGDISCPACLHILTELHEHAHPNAEVTCICSCVEKNWNSLKHT